MLIGRAQERELLRNAVDEARAERGSIVLLAGEAGVGKTVLARSVLEESGSSCIRAPGYRAARRPTGR